MPPGSSHTRFGGAIMGRQASVGLSALVLGLGLSLVADAAPLPFQRNDFETGTTLNWGDGGPANTVSNSASGGPLGADDNYLRVTSAGGGGAGSRMIVLNRGSQWTGNFAASGIPAVEMDLKNFGNAPLSMRIALMSGTNNYVVSTTPTTLANDGQWHHMSFSLAPSALTANGASAASILGSVTEFRILHSTGVDHRGDPIVGLLGLDNIAAVPEPAALALASATTLLLMRRRTR
jgi:hypothetical protein